MVGFVIYGVNLVGYLLGSRINYIIVLYYIDRIWMGRKWNVVI